MLGLLLDNNPFRIATILHSPSLDIRLLGALPTTATAIRLSVPHRSTCLDTTLVLPRRLELTAILAIARLVGCYELLGQGAVVYRQAQKWRKFRLPQLLCPCPRPRPRPR